MGDVLGGDECVLLHYSISELLEKARCLESHSSGLVSHAQLEEVLPSTANASHHSWHEVGVANHYPRFFGGSSQIVL
jgi:hypothetical protein